MRNWCKELAVGHTKMHNETGQYCPLVSDGTVMKVEESLLADQCMTVRDC